MHMLSITGGADDRSCSDSACRDEGAQGAAQGAATGRSKKRRLQQYRVVEGASRRRVVRRCNRGARE